MPSLLQRLVLVLYFGCVVLGALPARADSRAPPKIPEARAHFDRGGKLFTLREFEKAIDEYKQGALIESLPVFDLALGQCYRMLHRSEDAFWHYERFIKYGHPTGNVLKGVNDLIALVRAELDEQMAMTQKPAKATPDAAPQHRPTTFPHDPTSASHLSGPATEHHRSKVIPLMLGGAAVALIGGAVGFDLWGDSTYDKSKSEFVDTKQSSLWHAANTKRYVAESLSVASIACASIAVWLYLRNTDREAPATTRETNRLTVEPIFGRDQAGLVLEGRY